MFGIKNKGKKVDENTENLESKTEKIAKDSENKNKKEGIMAQLVADIPNPPAEGDLVEGSVINIDKGAVYIDLPPFGTGIIFGREYIVARDVIKKINIGDSVAAKVVETNNAAT